MSTSSTIPTVNRRDLDFQLFEVLDAQALTSRPVHADHDASTFAAVLDVAQSIAADKFQTHYRESDLHEPHVEGGKVRIIPQVREGLRAFAEAGFMMADRPFDEGGQQLPFTLLQACLACFQAANIGPRATTSSPSPVRRSFASSERPSRSQPTCARCSRHATSARCA